MYISKAAPELTKHRPVNTLATGKASDFNILDLKLIRKNITAVATPTKYYKMKPRSPKTKKSSSKVK